MAGASLLALIDDIVTVLDDVALMTKVAAKKTAGVLGDDLALNAQQVSGVPADRELPVVWAVAKGSLLNKAILVPAALAISAFVPWLVTPLLMLGGLYLCLEGAEKVFHSFSTAKPGGQGQASPMGEEGSSEAEKIKGAIRTDFVLSAEIIAITLGTVTAQSISTQFAVLAGVALLLTVAVYGLVAAIVKLDDLGLALSQHQGENTGARALRVFGFWLLDAAPRLMSGLAIVGTIAMFLVGGGILIHGLPLHNELDQISAAVGPVLDGPVLTMIDAVVGLLAGAAALLGLKAVTRLRNGRSGGSGGSGH
jgi:predicted DNA repair protein MutK